MSKHEETFFDHGIRAVASVVGLSLAIGQGCLGSGCASQERRLHWELLEKQELQLERRIQVIKYAGEQCKGQVAEYMNTDDCMESVIRGTYVDSGKYKARVIADGKVIYEE